MLNKIGGRKVILGILVIAVGVIIDLINDNGLSTNLLYLLTFISSGFFLSNGIEHLATSIKRRRSKSPAAAVNTDTVPVAEVNQTVRYLVEQNQNINNALDALTTNMQGLNETLGKLANRRPLR